MLAFYLLSTAPRPEGLGLRIPIQPHEEVEETPMASKKTPSPGAARKATGKKAGPVKAKKELSDKDLDAVAGGVAKFRAGKALKDSVK